MTKERDEIMDDLAAQVKALIDQTCEPGKSIFDGQQVWRDKAWLWTLMVEAHMNGSSPIVGKLEHQSGDINKVDVKDRISRLAAAMAYASDWEIKRKAA